MSEIIYHEEIGEDIASPLIGEDNLKSGAKYYLITEQFSSIVLRVEANGDETEFALESSTESYSDGIDFAKIDPVIEETKKSHAGVFMFVITALAFCSGIAAIAFLLLNN